MASRKSPRPEKAGPRWLLEAVAILLAAAALFLGLSMGSYHPTDPSWGVEAPAAEVRNTIGPIGANVAYSFYEVLGFASWVLPPILAAFAALVLTGHRVRAHLPKIAGAVLSVLSVAALLQLIFPEGVPLRGGTVRAGGFVGDSFATSLSGWFHVTGAALIAGTALLLGLQLLVQIPLRDSALRIGASLKRGFRKSSQVSVGVATGVARTGAAAAGGTSRAVGAGFGGGAGWLRTRWTRYQEARAVAQKEKEARREEARKKKAALAAAKVASRAAARKTEPGLQEPEKRAREELAPSAAARARLRRKKKKKQAEGGPTITETAATREAPQRAAAPVPRAEAGFTLPDEDLFDPAEGRTDLDEQDLLHNAQLIVAKYAEFGIEGKVLQIHPGPVVTTYEFKPEAGIKYSKITGLSEDLCLALRAESIRIDRIPGKSTVGVEVPNRDRQTIRMSEIITDEVYSQASSRVTLALGKTIEGDPYATDLAKMPHLLIAGSTGSGKSVCLNSMIASIMFRATPEQVRFILIDPKRLELGLYRDIPHLYTPVVTDPKLAVNALQWAVHQMEERYKLLAEESVRNIDQYNEYVRNHPTATSPDGEPLHTIPYIVIVVDELADLLLVTRGGVEESLARLAQMARAVGIHLILATQRPSVDVLTGVIKANFPSRISFRVTSRVDSRTVLDANGAEQLLGKGDLLFMPPGSARLLRLHAPYLTEKEIIRLTEHWKAQAEPSYREDVVAAPKAAEKELEDFDDELYDQAARIVVDRQEASVSYLQRRLRIGYARAARLVDLMEQDGIVGPSPETGGKMREVLVPTDYYTEIDAAQL